MNASDLTIGERLILCRRRASLTQRVAARSYGVKLHRYRRWELDKGDDANGSAPPVIGVGRLAQHEVYFIRRRRAGIGLGELAGTMEISRWWLSQMERGLVSIERLSKYWDRAKLSGTSR